jgi:hypothetical protein
VQRKIRIGGRKAGNEVIFESTDGTFSGIAAMYIWWSELGINVVIGQILE